MFYGGGQNQTTIECLYMESPMEATKIKTTIEGASWRWPKTKTLNLIKGLYGGDLNKTHH